MPDAAALRDVVAHVSLLSFAFAFLAGLVLSFNPGSFAAIPVAVGYFASGARDARHAFLLAGAFVAGTSAADVLLGVLFAAAGNYAVAMVFGPRWGLVIGPVLLLLGLRWLNIVSFRLPVLAPKGRKTATYAGAFVLGLPFSLAVCPFCVPALVTILTVAAATGKGWYSAGLPLGAGSRSSRRPRVWGRSSRCGGWSGSSRGSRRGAGSSWSSRDCTWSGATLIRRG